MNKQDRNKLVMLKALLSYLKLNQAIWENSEPFAAAVAELQKLIAAIETTVQSTTVNRSGLVAEKRTFKIKLVDAIFGIATQIRAMAIKTNDEVLQAKVDFSKSELETKRDGELAWSGRTILNLAVTYLQGLATYGITEAELNLLDELIMQYETSLPTPRLSVTDRKAGNIRLKGFLADAMTLLNNQFKLLIVRYKHSNPEFYEGYLLASKIVDYGIRHEKPEAPVNP